MLSLSSNGRARARGRAPRRRLAPVSLAALSRSRAARLALALAAGLALALAAGCGEDETLAPAPLAGARIAGFVRRADNAQPVTDATVWLVAEDGITLAAGPARTDAAGAYAFAGISPGTYTLAANTSAGLCLVPFAGHGVPFTIVEGDTVAAGRDLLMRSLAIGCTRPPAILMQVFDEASGAPVTGARISQRTLDVPFDGSLDMYTDERGEALFDATTATIASTDRRALSAMIVHHPAYEVRVFPGEGLFIVVPEGSPPVVRIGLRAASGDGAAVIRGRVVSGDAATSGEPLGGVRVALALTSPMVRPPAKAFADSAAFNLFATTTDSAGIFEFRGLREAEYLVRPAYLPVDGLVSLAGPDEGPYRVASEDAQIATPDLRVVRALAVFEPAPGFAAPSDTIVFRWASAPGATRYLLALRGSFEGSRPEFAATADTSVSIAFFPSGEPYRWFVAALDAGDRELSRSEPPRIVTPGPAR